MRPNRTYLFISISSIALLTVLIIQVSWILQTAKMKEELFHEKANMVLSKTAEALSRDKEIFKNMQLSVGKKEVHKIDSLFKYYMKAYNIHIDYAFEVKPDPSATFMNFAGLKNGFSDSQPRCGSYQICSDGETPGMELKLTFPKQEQFIKAEMGIPFITSVILILLVLIISWRTIFSLLKEKKISEHTTDFLNNMTHEFKTPLTNIALAGKMISKDTSTGKEEKIKHYSGIILEENEKLRLQVEQVLSMTALERGEIPLHKTEIDLHQLIHDALKNISIQIEHRQGDVKLKLAAERFVIMGDKTHLTNALCNLVDNAIKYSKGKPGLLIETKDNSENFTLIISDKGIGIEKKYKKKVFDKFFRVPTGNVHDVKGFGLGLAYVKTIVEMHGGTIKLESEKGKGTIFIITLPHA
jgi:two-component system phosphate regulon sensor histidine kinase PhoR